MSSSTNSTLSETSSSYTDTHDPAGYMGKSLSEDDKLQLLTSTWKTPTYKFPVTSGRRFNPTWLINRPWLRYSVKNDSIFCISCLCFGPSESPFVSPGFKNWKKALGKKGYIELHKRSKTHKAAEEKAALFLLTRQPGMDIQARITKQVSDQQIRTYRGILSIIDIIISLGQRGIPLRGNWNRVEKSEDGNFAFFVNWKSEFHRDLKEHLKHATDNGKYTSPMIQNEVIHLCEGFIREKILSCIPKYWSLMADETQDCSTAEQLSICVRYVNDIGEICEDFIGFIKLEKMDAQSISDKLLSGVEGWGLDMSYIVAQGYDGASVMSSNKNGVQAKVKDKYPNATYVHCRSHVLNLAISSGCNNVPPIRNLFDSVEKLTWFLSGSAKRKEIFLQIASSEGNGQELFDVLTTDSTGDLSESAKTIKEGGKKKTVPKLCVTRWTARVSTLSAILAKYFDILRALEKIRDCSTGDARSNASSYIRLLEDSQFIVALTVAHYVLSFLGNVTTALQTTDCNLADAYDDVALAKECIRDSRNEDCWKKIWTRVDQIASTVGIAVIKPRTARSQQHRANAGTTDQSNSDYYRINVFYPFIDHVIKELETRFSNDHEGLISVQYLVPIYLSQLTRDRIDLIEGYYNKFLMLEEKENFGMEILKWKKCYEAKAIRDKPKSAIEAFSQCSPQTFPILHKIFMIFLTTPVGSVSCERSFSALRRLKLWTRSSMTEDRLSGLAMMLIHRGTEYIPTPQEVYSRKSNWRQFS